jgi:hypothetical protein
VNTGSVGRSKEKRISDAYLMLTIAESRIRPELVRVAYPVEETIKAILERTIPDFCADFLLEMVESGTTRKRLVKRDSLDGGVKVPTQ